MNTKQKLTLGIAAIFMVTLTIVGVTYAYFVTQVQTGTEAGANVTTATFGEITFVKEDESVTLDAMANDDTKSLNYSVTNTGDSALSYDNIIRTAKGDKDFIHSLSTAESTPLEGCYNLTQEAEATAPGECFTGSYYDNITVVVTRYTDSARTQGATVVYNSKLQASPLSFDIENNVPIAANTTHYYTITVTHDDAGKNQNLEQTAKVTVIPDIDSVG